MCQYFDGGEMLSEPPQITQAFEDGRQQGLLRASAQWMTPTQIGEAAIVAIGCYPFTSGLDGQGGKERIGHKIPFHTALPAEVYENIPMPRARIDMRAIRLVANLLYRIPKRRPLRSAD